MEKMFKDYIRGLFTVAMVITLSFTGLQTSEAAIKLVDPDQQQVAQVQSRSTLETLAPANASPRLEVLDSGTSTNRGLETLGSSGSNVEVLDSGTLDTSFEVSKIYVSNRVTGKKSAYTLRSYNDYKVLLDQLETGTVILITNPIQVSNINRWTQEVSERFTEKNKGTVVSFSDVNVLSPQEIKIFTEKAGLDLTKIKAIEIRKEFKNNIVRYDDGKTDFDRGMETVNNIVSTWNLIDNLRH